MFCPVRVTAPLPTLVTESVPAVWPITALTFSPVPVELRFAAPFRVSPPVCNVPAPAVLPTVPVVIVTALSRIAPLLIFSAFAPTAIVPPLPALAVAPSTVRVPSLIVVPPA